MVKLPVFDVLGRAFTAPARYWWPLLPYFIGAAVITIGIFLTIMPNFPIAVPSADGVDPVNQASIGKNVGLILLGVSFLIFLFFSFAVLVHRQVAGTADKWKLGIPTLKYIGVSILISILMIILGAAVLLGVGVLGGGTALFGALVAGVEPGGISYLGGAVGFVAIFVLYALYARLSLALPATAIGEHGTISLAWQISRGNSLRLLAVWVLYLVLVFVLEMVVLFLLGGATVFSGEGGSFMAMLGTIVMVIFYYYYIVFGIAFLTYSYLALAPNKDIPGATSQSPGIAPS